MLKLKGPANGACIPARSVGLFVRLHKCRDSL